MVRIATSYNVPSDELSPAASIAHAAPSLVNLAGTWENTDASTAGIIRIVLTDHHHPGNVGVHVFGACQPSPCDWKEVRGIAYATSVAGGNGVAFTATYNFGFKSTIVTGVLQNGDLLVQDFNTFKDGSGECPESGGM